MYENATREIVPAVRSYLAKELIKRGLGEEKIASLLGVAQAAVSKYANDRYSEKVKKIERRIDKKIIDAYIDQIVLGKKEYANACICKICQSICAFDCTFSTTDEMIV